MRQDVEFYIRKKCRCIVSKTPNVLETAPLVPIESSYPFELVCIDFLKLSMCQGGYRYALLVTDHFTRFSQAYATKSKTSKAAAAELFYKFIPQFGLPHRIHHDRGGEFNSELFAELHRLGGIEISNTTPFHPMGNGMVERLNRTLIQMLTSIPESEKRDGKTTYQV
jgi:transposase InsO family protein